MNWRTLPLKKMRAMRTNRDWLIGNTQQLILPGLAMAAVVSMVLASFLSGCVNVVTYTQPTLVRVIDASYAAPAINVVVESTILAGNVGQGTITPYGTLTASTAAPIKITAATGGAALLTTSGILLAGHQHSILISDNAAVPGTYAVTILEDQQIAAAGGHSAFRFLNQALKTGAVDIYMIPAGVTLANSIPIVTNLAVGNAPVYISFLSQTVTLVVTPTGTTTPKYTSAPIALIGGEVRTVLLVDTQLTSTPAIQAFIANDVN